MPPSRSNSARRPWSARPGSTRSSGPASGTRRRTRRRYQLRAPATHPRRARSSAACASATRRCARVSASNSAGERNASIHPPSCTSGCASVRASSASCSTTLAATSGNRSRAAGREPLRRRFAPEAREPAGIRGQRAVVPVEIDRAVARIAQQRAEPARKRVYGTTDERSISPALPWLVSSPGARRSTSATRSPRSCSRCSADDTPTMPAPER